MTVVETEEFLKHAKPLMSELERAELAAFVGANPEAAHPGDWRHAENPVGASGHGQAGGARIICYYNNEGLPVFLLSAYAKNRKANLSKAERNAMKRLVPALVAGYPRKA